MKLKGKVLWITGASSGIGEATAYLAAKKGTKLILSSNQPEEQEKVAIKCREMGTEAVALFIDLGNAEKIPEVVQTALQHYGRVDILFNNGGLSQRAFMLDAPLELQRRLMEINYFGAIHLAKLVVPQMIENGGGQLVTTTSIAGKFGAKGRTAYCASKHALYGFFEAVHAEYVHKGIRVTFVCPGRVRTDISKHALTADGSPTGKMDAGLAGGIPVEKAAQQIIRAIEKEKKDVLIGGKELLMVYIKKFFPGLYYKMIPNVKD